MKRWISVDAKPIRWKEDEEFYSGGIRKIMPGGKWSILTPLNLRQSDIICQLIWCNNKYIVPIMKSSCPKIK